MSLIIILDDEESIQDLLKRSLEKYSDIEIYGNEEEMLKSENLKKADLFVIDIKLNGRTGIDVARNLSNICPGTPFLFISGYSDVTDELFEFTNKNVVDFISKPISLTSFRNRVSVLLRASNYVKAHEIETSNLKKIFKTIFQSSPVAISISEIETGRLIEVNQAFADLVKYSKDDLIDNSIFDLNIVVDPDKQLQALNELYSNKKFQNIEMKLCDSKGSIKHCLVFGETLTLSDNQNILLTLVVDMTERKSLIENLWHVFNYSMFYALIIDRDMVIRLCNFSLAKELGFESESQILGKNFKYFIPESSRVITDHILKDLITKDSEEMYVEFTHDLQAENNRISPVKWFYTYMNKDTNLIFCIGIPLNREQSFEESTESIRSYFKDIIKQDHTTMLKLKEKVQETINHF